MTMPPERWRQIEDIFHAALEREPAARPAFLEKACGGDEALRREVEALLQQDARGGVPGRPIEKIADEMPAGDAGDRPFADSFTPGFMAGPYRIGERIGAGGMGEVYRAKDTRLNRTVAIKTLKGRFTERFEREARAISALNHPHICTLYDIGSQDGTGYLVMEYVEGAPLKGPLKIEEALRLAIQIASALEAAHEKGILHRDLKPGNILVSKSGVKLLDFGLAKFVPTENRPAEETVTASLTGTGQILGTLGYMAPEQIEGKPADARSDIFCFGLVLYEMLTGRRAFEASSQTGLMAATLKDDPPSLTTLQPSIPPALDRTVRKCLAKDPGRRWQAASDLRDELAWIGASESAAPRAIPGRALLPWIASAAGLLALIAAIILWGPWRASPAAGGRPFLQVDIDAGRDEVSQAAISSDGTTIVFVSNRKLAIRRLDETKITPLADTEGASYPFFSPDGKWVAFFAGIRLQKIAVQGGAPVPLCDAQDGRGGSWGEDGNIIAALSPGEGLSLISAAGGVPQALTELKAEPVKTFSHRWPQTLPGGKSVLFAVTNGTSIGSLRVLTLKTGKIETIIENSTFGRYLASGYLVYYQHGTLFAAPMDAGRLQLTGPPVALVDGVAYNSSGRADFDLSASGTLVYRRAAVETKRVPSWLYSSGKIERILPAPASYLNPRLSPDGTRLALVVNQEGKQNLWVYDFRLETLRRLTVDASPEFFPTWTPNGEFLVFQSGNALAWTRSDGGGKVEFPSGVSNGSAGSFSPDAKWLAYSQTALKTAPDLWTLPVEQMAGALRFGRPEPLLELPRAQFFPAISPDGRWLAYFSGESGPFEIYVMPFSPQGAARPGKLQISHGAAGSPRWSRKELFYEGTDRRIQVAGYTVKGDSFVADKPRLWSEKRLADSGFFSSFDVAPDGTRVVAIVETDEAGPETHFRVLLNLGDELRRRAQAGRK